MAPLDREQAIRDLMYQSVMITVAFRDKMLEMFFRVAAAKSRLEALRASRHASILHPDTGPIDGPS